MSINLTLPVVGGDSNSWGTKNNNALTAIENALNGLNYTLPINLSNGSWKIGGTVVTATAADLNYAEDLRATGVTATEFNKLDGLMASTADLNKTIGLTATSTELNKLDGATVTTAEINHLDGVTSGIQSQLDDKADSASPSFTGTLNLPENWSIQIDGSGNSSVLRVKYNGTAILKLTTAGHLTLEDNITAFGNA